MVSTLTLHSAQQPFTVMLFGKASNGTDNAVHVALQKAGCSVSPCKLLLAVMDAALSLLPLTCKTALTDPFAMTAAHLQHQQRLYLQYSSGDNPMGVSAALLSCLSSAKHRMCTTMSANICLCFPLLRQTCLPILSVS